MLIEANPRKEFQRSVVAYEYKSPAELNNKKKKKAKGTWLSSSTIFLFVAGVFAVGTFFHVHSMFIDSNVISHFRGSSSSRSSAIYEQEQLKTTKYFRTHQHPSYAGNLTRNATIDDHMVYLSNLPQCKNKPIFVSMARLKTELYWQLIENFLYTMVKFGHIDCTVMACISDDNCMQRCHENSLPCFDYQHAMQEDHVMEHIATVKIYFVGLALERGVNVMLVDLDVGFMRDPLLLYSGFEDATHEQIRAQMDIGQVTDRPTNTEMVTPRPNFGLFLIKSHEYTIKLFKRAWQHYVKTKKENRYKVAIDQNCVVDSIKWAAWRWQRFNFSYYYLGFVADTSPRPIHFDKKTYLLDKMYKVGTTEDTIIRNNSEMHKYKPVHDHTLYGDGATIYELGGAIAAKELTDAVAVHATCHEGSTKLQALKASNTFWKPDYYSRSRKTLTKPLMALSRHILLREIHALAFLAQHTGRTLIIPNVLIGMGVNIEGGLSKKSCKQNIMPPEYKPSSLSTASEITNRSSSRSSGTSLGKKGVNETYYCQALLDGTNKLNRNSYEHTYEIVKGEGEFYWPAWRTYKGDDKTVLSSSSSSSATTTTSSASKNSVDTEEDKEKEEEKEEENTHPMIEFVEPAFYYRMQRDFNITPPEPFILSLDFNRVLDRSSGGARDDDDGLLAENKLFHASGKWLRLSKDWLLLHASPSVSKSSAIPSNNRKCLAADLVELGRSSSSSGSGSNVNGEALPISSEHRTNAAAPFEMQMHQHNMFLHRLLRELKAVDHEERVVLDLRDSSFLMPLSGGPISAAASASASASSSSSSSASTGQEAATARDSSSSSSTQDALLQWIGSSYSYWPVPPASPPVQLHSGEGSTTKKNLFVQQTYINKYLYFPLQLHRPKLPAVAAATAKDSGRIKQNSAAVNMASRNTGGSASSSGTDGGSTTTSTTGGGGSAAGAMAPSLTVAEMEARLRMNSPLANTLHRAAEADCVPSSATMEIEAMIDASWEWLDKISLCGHFLDKTKGNRSCFDRCK